MNKLFIICPTAYLEQSIREQFVGKLYFFSALGGVMDLTDFDLTESLNSFLIQNKIEEICLVQNLSCPFLRGVILDKQRSNTIADQSLRALKNNNQYIFRQKIGFQKLRRELAKLSLFEQSKGLESAPFLGNKIKSNEIRLTTYLYDNSKEQFYEIPNRNHQISAAKTQPSF